MSSSTGLRRFVSGPPSAAQAGAAQNLGLRQSARQETQAPGEHPRQPEQAGPEHERCEVCAADIPAQHSHLADIDHASLLCACRACYLLFTQREAVRGRFRAVPDRYLTDPSQPLSPAEWDELQIPVGLAFFLRGSRTGTVTGFYPSPAGATECRLDLAAWTRLTGAHRLLAAAEPDVEAVLITRSEQAGIECFVVPIDACYELAGRMRLHWRGFDGGAEARRAIADFLDTVRSRAIPEQKWT
ncbi:MAG TPA: DUF5947 family protein [Streptosporangiaceae bacterium]|nr:DUF5947 family protein [Streptosporangiaceae bacterium]